MTVDGKPGMLRKAAQSDNNVVERMFEKERAIMGIQKSLDFCAKL